MDSQVISRTWVIGVVVALAAGFAGGYWYGNRSGIANEQAAQAERREAAGAEAAKAVNPFSDAAANPFEKNPANPFEGVKVNPFE